MSARRSARAPCAPLAAFSLLSVLAVVLLCQARAQSEERTLEVSRVWSERADQAARLDEAARAAGAPARDAFASGDLAAERARLGAHSASFLRLCARARIRLAELPSEELRVLAQHLERASGTFDAMVADADAIFGALERGETAEAGRHLAAMQRQRALTSHALGALSRVEARLSRRALAQQAEQASRLSRWAWALSGVAALCLAGAVRGAWRRAGEGERRRAVGGLTGVG